MIRKRLLSLVLGAMLVITSLNVTVPVFAADNAPTESSQTVTYHTDTRKSDATPAQVTAKFTIPKGFGLSAYVMLMGEDGQQYQITASEENGYNDRIWLPYGKYIVLSSGIMNDTKNTYGFTVDYDDFTLDSTNQSMIVTAKMIDYNKIAEQIEDKTGEKVDRVDEDTSVKVELYDTAIDYIKMNSSGVPYYTVDSTNDYCTAYLSGNAKGDYGFYLEVTKPGVLGEAKAKLSLDGGKSYLGELTLKDTVSLKAYGLTLTLSMKNSTNEFAVGDSFTATTIENFQTTQKNPKTNNILAAGNPKSNVDITVNILSTGKRGVAKFSLSTDNGNTTKAVSIIPESGEYTYGDITLYFSDGEYIKNNSYTVTVKTNIKKKNYVPAFVLGAIAVTAFAVVYAVLLTKKEKKSDYTIMPWTDRQKSDKYN